MVSATSGGRPAWTKLHRRWLAGLRFEQAAHHLVLEDYIQTVEAAATRRDRLTAQIGTRFRGHDGKGGGTKRQIRRRRPP
jgi:hypothetical protein